MNITEEYTDRDKVNHLKHILFVMTLICAFQNIHVPKLGFYSRFEVKIRGWIKVYRGFNL